MKKYLFSICLICYVLNIEAQSNNKVVTDPVLIGICKLDSLQKAPYNIWYTKNYDDYKPTISTIVDLKKASKKDLSISIFFGSWCGDSKREVPRFYKILKEINFDLNNIKLVGLSAADSMYKQNPMHDEKNLGIYKVPTFIVYKKGIEINRIVEFPALSLEQDLLEILTTNKYIPSYKCYLTLEKWLNNGTLLNENISTKSISNIIKNEVMHAGELNSFGYFLLNNKNYKEALKVFKLNVTLYPENANAYNSLIEGFIKNKDRENAILYLEKYFEMIKFYEIKAALKLHEEALKIVVDKK